MSFGLDAAGAPMYRRCVRVSRRALTCCLGLYVATQALLLVRIGSPRLLDFDEFHYVPAARALLQAEPDPVPEHPPLGKELIAAGLAVAGDDALGWRMMSTLFGALTVVGLYLWALALFRDEATALFAALLTLVDQLVYVQARVAMLDVFMFAFMAWAWAAFCASWEPGLPPAAARRLLLFTGLMLGLSSACKWSGVPAWAAMAAMVGAVRLLQRWGARLRSGAPGDWYHPDLWRGLRARDFVLSLGVVPLIAYLLPFLPLLLIPGASHSPAELWRMQWRIWDGQLRVVGTHPYISAWPTWPLMTRPVWYAFDADGAGWARGVVLLGNPLVMWPGLAALAVCAWGWIQERRRDAFLILAAYAALYLPWAVIPRKLSFYYYYYPAGVSLSLALAYAFGRLRSPWLRWAYLAAAACVFVYFLPVLAAMRIEPSHLRRWAWFSSWI